MRKLRMILIAICLLIMFASGFLMIRRVIELHKEESEYEQLRTEMDVTETAEPVTEPTTEEPQHETETEPQETEPQFEAPKALLDAMAEYPDMVGWITIDGTKVDYPIMQNEDNEYYLHRNYMGEDAVAGSIYLDSNHDINAKGLHSIYGHHMKNGSMFKDISKFVNKTYLEEHQNITIVTDKQELHLKPVYCYAAKSDTTYRQILSSHAQVVQFIIDHTGQEIDADDLFVLITCSYGSADERTYLYCVPVEEDELADRQDEMPGVTQEEASTTQETSVENALQIQ